MSILVREGTTKWQKASQTEFGDEIQLQKFLYESPELLEWQDDQPVAFTRESALPGSGYTDLIGVAGNGDILLVETKLAKNPEIRRKGIGQVVEYAVFLWGMEYEDFNRFFVEREGKSIPDLLCDKAQRAEIDKLESAVSKNLKEGNFYLLIAVDEMNKELERIIAYLSSRGSGLKLEALAVRVFRSGTVSVLAPQRYGQLSQPPVGPGNDRERLTVDQIVERSPDEHTRSLMQFTIRGWTDLGHFIVPGTSGLSCRADVSGVLQPFFWVEPSGPWGIQPLFKELENRGAPTQVALSWRKAVSNLRGFAGHRCLTDKRPPAPFPGLAEETIKEFLQLTNEVVREWRSASAAKVTPR